MSFQLTTTLSASVLMVVVGLLIDLTTISRSVGKYRSQWPPIALTRRALADSGGTPIDRKTMSARAALGSAWCPTRVYSLESTPPGRGHTRRGREADAHTLASRNSRTVAR